jgi:hypothetical protein
VGAFVMGLSRGAGRAIFRPFGVGATVGSMSPTSSAGSAGRRALRLGALSITHLYLPGSDERTGRSDRLRSSRRARRGSAFYAQIRTAEGKRLQRRLGKTWTTRGRPPEGYLTRA